MPIVRQSLPWGLVLVLVLAWASHHQLHFRAQKDQLHSKLMNGPLQLRAQSLFPFGWLLGDRHRWIPIHDTNEDPASNQQVESSSPTQTLICLENNFDSATWRLKPTVEIFLDVTPLPVRKRPSPLSAASLGGCGICSVQPVARCRI